MPERLTLHGQPLQTDTETLDEAIVKMTLEDLIRGLGPWTNRTIGLHDIMTLQPHDIKDLSVYLQDETIERRFEKRRRGDPLALLKIVTRRLEGQFSRIRPESVELATRQLFSIVLNPPQPEATAVVSTPEIFTLEKSLDEALKCLSDEQLPGSVDKQLGDYVHLLTLGLVINPPKTKDAPESHGFSLPVRLLNILKALKDPKAATGLENWLSITLMDSEKKDPCLRLLRDLVSISWVLDSGTLLALYPSTGGRIALYPFRALNNAVRAVKKFFSDYGGDSETVRMLENLERQIQSRFHEALAGPLKDDVDADVIDACRPELIDIVKTYIDWFEDHPDTDPQHVVDFALRLIEQSGHRAAYFVDAVKMLGSSELAKLIETEAIRRGLIILSKPEMRKVRVEACEEIQERLTTDPWKDLMSLDFRELIPDETEQVLFLIATGTFGPFTTDGHGRMIQELLNYTYYQDELERILTGHNRTRRFVVALPLLATPHKEFAEVGTLEERAGSIILAATHLGFPKNRFLISTQLQPDPADAGSSVRGFHAITNAINAKIGADFGKSKVYFGTTTMLVFGADELSLEHPEGQPPVLEPLVRQPRKARDLPNVILSRSGLLLTILEGTEIIHQLNTSTCILYPSTKDASSTAARKAVLVGRTREFFPADLIPFIETHWSGARRSARASIPLAQPGTPTPTIPKVDRINVELIKEYRAFLKGLKGQP